MKKLKHSAGSTAVVAIVTPKHYIIANCGDSRCVVSRGVDDESQQALWASKDHKPSDVRAAHTHTHAVEPSTLQRRSYGNCCAMDVLVDALMH